MRVLLLGGTTEASALAKTLKIAGIETVFSYAGRTGKPILQPVPTRIGGFGGVDGLSTYLRQEGITHVVDATHPFAAGMSRNAVAACDATETPLIRLERPHWRPTNADNWINVPSIAAAADALPDTPARVFLAIGKQHLAIFARKPQHHYLLRLVDAPQDPLPLPSTTVLQARGPFTVTGDKTILQDHAITHIVAKNAGGTAAIAKLHAARALGVPVIMIDRPVLPETTIAPDTETFLRLLGHEALRGV